MISLTRKLLIGVGLCAVFQNVANASSLPSYNALNQQIHELNKRDKYVEKDKINNDLKQWKPVEGYEELLTKFDNNVVDTLHYISVMYEKPLKTFQKIFLREQITNFYKQSLEEKEKEFYINVLKYYELLE
jgi:hypothetical protein